MSYYTDSDSDLAARADAIVAAADRAWERPDVREAPRGDIREDELDRVFARADAIADEASRAWLRPGEEPPADVRADAEPVRAPSRKAKAEDEGVYVDEHGARWRSKDDYDRAWAGQR